ncbi:transglutaminase superfamily protein [Mucilaginibacter oryzae]|uniref:Transglutaminase superfamily protein n=2 Tax=Mucilaginibacter oryzae TaxID=468058 RepID=A0A316HTH0_9SPHI|nr:transglutaminase superfamily protein [Mucilaginibacter oryzae]
MFIFIAGMQRFFKIVFGFSLCLVFLFWCSGAAFGNAPVVHISAKPAWAGNLKPYNQRPSARTIERGFYYALIEQQLQVEKQADYNHVIREIVSETGIQNASQISVSFDPAYERLDFHDITVWRNGKPLNRLKASSFKVLADEQDLSNFIYQGSFSALCILDDIRKGDRIEYSYTITGRNPILNGRFCGDLYFQWGTPIAHHYIALIALSTRKLNFKTFNTVPKPLVTRDGGLTTYAYEGFQIPPAHDDNTQPSWYNERGLIQVSEFSTWADVVNWALSINPPSLNIKGELAARIAQLKKDAGNSKEKYFRAAVRTVQQEVRYMGIEIGEYSHRANNPEKVFKQRYGDCKDKSLLLVSMLKANGIDAQMVLVNADLNEHVEQYIPTAYAFNHAVVTANVNGKQVWVDATMDNQGGEGTDIYFPRYGKGLVLKAGNDALTTIPPSKNGMITCEDVYTIKDVKSPVLFTVTTVYSGDEADYVRGRLESSGINETEKNYLDYYSKIYNKIEARDSIQVKDDISKNILTTIETYKVGDFLKKDSASGKLNADLFANFINNQLPSITGRTKTPVALTYPYNAAYTIKVVLPGGWDISEDHDAINRDYYRYESNFTSAGDTLKLNYKLAFLKDNVPVNKLDEFRADVKKLNNTSLGYSFSYTPDKANRPSTINNTLVAFAVVVAFGLILLAVWLYQRETPGIVFAYGSTFVPIGGWLILVALGLAGTTLITASRIISVDYFSLHSWNLYHNTRYAFSFRILLVVEMLGNLVLMAYALFCLVLLLNKRDILPTFITGYFVFGFVFFLADYILAAGISSKLAGSALNPLIRSVIVAAIWIPYFRRSSRVQETFIVPHPPYNYSYEGPESPQA